MLGWAVLAVLAVLAAGDVSVPVTNHWNGGFQGKACFSITQEMSSWKVHLHFDQPISSLEVCLFTHTRTHTHTHTNCRGRGGNQILKFVPWKSDGDNTVTALNWRKRPTT